MLVQATRKSSPVEALLYSGDHQSLMEFVGEYLVFSNNEPLIMTTAKRLPILLNHYIIKEKGRKGGLFYILTKEDFEKQFDIAKPKKEKWQSVIE